MSCPNCGYCPHCGRGGVYNTRPYWTTPYYYGNPLTTGYLQVTTTTGSFDAFKQAMQQAQQAQDSHANSSKSARTR